MILLKNKKIIKKAFLFYDLDLHLLYALGWWYNVVRHFFTLHQCLGDVCVQSVSEGLWILMSTPKPSRLFELLVAVLSAKLLGKCRCSRS